MALRIRPAKNDDAQALTQVVNPIIAAGGTTAHQTPFDASRLLRHYIAPPQLISCQVAERDGIPIGFQTLVWPDDDGDPFPEGWAIIASFVSPDASGSGIGRKLFDATKAVAEASGVSVIDATIRSDNVSGLRYYEAMGFRDYDVLHAVPLRDGTLVDRIRKRYDL
ncbi:GNAT family N-acetyltransferase [Ponticoccus sp. SC2-23]|uniref:GNAT family N-acetyltransferase n=1 Tax=Alexandriicola marinus TaxID=2081710 RepID=UPI000FD8961C|nr:GNAT family N-acetyltransferase [Alexandriicola marinus]MBM1220751.1 GNAT family N-acetyltransferase [Ponticoccus sp. SC6-9]MBM1226010.1 GNAT family N-acetyltransferase [Ponticoccus sp. SC6-15]MBM1231307.1 GNAT family N-acetyltransferase [Ponticoccus sp. SC6-38]MBM1235832.1 GNAT family N-acetyltransferase [Ponticoccus sp. SC6-45]MBM1240330.1 GNAT family N-acetyltransferase [Ponticoccus sp. SC6-49]MBM1244865.1 GNAT family N-acetyltransferase [Ponticoccus sp. SC2-64]MBM1249306.1 GNAT family